MISVVVPNASGILILRDIQGKQLISRNINTNNTELNIESLTPGLYYIEVSTDKGRAVQKLIKN